MALSMQQPYWDFPRSISAVRVLLAVAETHGLTQQACLKDSGICADNLSSAHNLIETRQELQVIRNIIQQLGSEVPLGVETGLRHHITTFGAWGFAMLSSPSIRAAINIALKYLRLSSVFCHLNMVEEGDKTLLLIDHQSLPEDLQYFLAERDFTTLMSLQRDILPLQLPVFSLEVALPAPVYTDRFPEMTGYAVKFDQPRSCITVNTSLLEMPLPQADPFTLARYEAECVQLLARRETLGRYSQKIQHHLLAQPAQMPTINDMASRLNINTRTLQRQLAEEGFTYEHLVEGVREDLAENLLMQTSLSIEQIAENLGYSEVSAFSRAFKRWKGIAPTKFRHQ
jgi:AraC-like DNA-binding protein